MLRDDPKDKKETLHPEPSAMLRDEQKDKKETLHPEENQSFTQLSNGGMGIETNTFYRLIIKF